MTLNATTTAVSLLFALEARGLGLRLAMYAPGSAGASYTTGDARSHDVTTTIAADPNLMPRPWRISTSGANGSFDTGFFSYDGSGNVVSMGTADTFGYDGVSRLTSATLGGGAQTYTYDVYGNLLTRTGPNPISLTVDATTNHVSSVGYSYDPRGNLTSPSPGETITYDALSQATTANVGGVVWTYYYSGAGERVVKNSSAGGNTFTFRDPGNRVTTEYAGATTVSSDNVFLGNLLVGSYANIGVSGNGAFPWVYYSSDHLGTPRLLTDNMGTTVETRRTWPFGEDVTPPPPITAERLRFATMERDPEGQRYYDHARSHSFGLARFMSPDKLGGKITDPQSWNRYAYARNNPLKYVDPDGRSPLAAALAGLGSTVMVPAPPPVLLGLAGVTGLYFGGRAALENIQVGGITLDEKLTRLFTDLLTLDMKSATRPGAAGGPTAGKRFPPTVQGQAAGQATDANGQTKCQNCGVPTGTEAGQIPGQTDHIIPKSQGGDATIDNAQHVCQTCNASAGAREEPSTTGAEKIIRRVPPDPEQQ